jgi:hypothetical protein
MKQEEFMKLKQGGA